MGKWSSPPEIHFKFLNICKFIKKRKTKSEKENLFTFGNGLAQFVWTINGTIDALRKVGFSEWIYSMPKKLNTPRYKDFEGDDVEISGGEAQKIALARALYKDAPFIVLDEPTLALDPIAVFHEGALIQRGSHVGLIARRKRQLL